MELSSSETEPETAGNEWLDQDLPVAKKLRAPGPTTAVTDDDMSGCDSEQGNNEKLASVNAKNHSNAPRSNAENAKQKKPSSRDVVEQARTALRSDDQGGIRSDQVRQNGGSQLTRGVEHRRNEVSREKRPNTEDGGECESSRCVTSTAYLAHVLVTHQ